MKWATQALQLLMYWYYRSHGYVFHSFISLELHYLAFECENMHSVFLSLVGLLSIQMDHWQSWPLTLVALILSRTSWHTHALFTDHRPALALPLLGIIAVCLVAWIHRRGILNISNQCVWRAWAWRSYTYSGKLHLALLIFLLYCVPVCVSICAST